ncbi:hypothetical protein [Cryptosporangium arvum]|uniref:hypothetical protein n=1 Tax=Cryptosporangium arvum TaxID=80871 RepID=UPI00055DFD38|nr:hypothetical protein [Cryptosporangium arvum]
MTSTPSTTDRAREAAGSAQHEGSALAQSAKESGAQVAQTAGSEASHVAAEAKAQAGDLLRTTRDEVNTQVDSQRRRLVDALRTTGDEFGSGGGQSALTNELSQRASTYARTFADYLDEKGPDAILADVRSFARRRPGTFLLLAGAAGVVAGRVFRSVSAASDDSGSGSGSDRRSAVDDQPRYSDETYPAPVYPDPVPAYSDPAPAYPDSTYSGLGVGATEPLPPVPATPRHAADDTAVGIAEVPASEPYPPAGPGYAEGYPAAPPGAPAATPSSPPPPPTPPVDDPYADPRYREDRR